MGNIMSVSAIFVGSRLVLIASAIHVCCLSSEYLCVQKHTEAKEARPSFFLRNPNLGCQAYAGFGGSDCICSAY